MFIFASLLVSGFLFVKSQPDGLLHVYFLDVGQGDSIFIRGPSGENIIVDGGPGQNVLSKLSDVLPYFDQEIDWLILSHPDKDHLEGLVAIIKKYSVKNVLFTGEAKKSFLYDSFLRQIKEKKIRPVLADENSDIAFQDDLFFDVLYPFSQIAGRQSAETNLSIVVKIVYSDNEILLTGDAEAKEENALLARKIDLKADVLKVGHHGSATSSSERFLESVAPIYSVISAGKENQYGHPHAATLNKLKKIRSAIFRTDDNGTVEFIFDKKGLMKINPQFQPA